VIRHHPDDALLIAHAGGTLATGPALLMATHLEDCAACLAALRRFEQVGTALMLDEPAATLAPDAFAATLARLDVPSTAPVAPLVSPRPPLPAGMNWPRSLRHCHVSRWRLLGPGMRWSRVTLPGDRRANVFLLRIAAGSCLPPHTHSGEELTQVLHGAFDDGRAVFGPGDFDATDESIRHQPVVQASSECICLASVDGRLVHDGFLARWMGALIGI
jgi:putative transcriptional regulator